MNTSTTTTDDWRARVVASMPEGADVLVLKGLLERYDDEDAAADLIRRFRPAWPMPQVAPLPTWATDACGWSWECAGDVARWYRLVRRPVEVDGRVAEVLMNQEVVEPGGPAIGGDYSLELDDVQGRPLTDPAGDVLRLAAALSELARHLPTAPVLA